MSDSERLQEALLQLRWSQDVAAELLEACKERRANERRLAQEIEHWKSRACQCTFGPEGQQCSKCEKTTELLVRRYEEGMSEGRETYVRAVDLMLRLYLHVEKVKALTKDSALHTELEEFLKEDGTLRR